MISQETKSTYLNNDMLTEFISTIKKAETTIREYKIN